MNIPYIPLSHQTFSMLESRKKTNFESKDLKGVAFRIKIFPSRQILKKNTTLQFLKQSFSFCQILK